LTYFILGGGSNLLINDKGFDGLIIKIKTDKIQVDKKQQLIIAESGVNLTSLVGQATEAGLSGMQWAAGIPGTLGGAVRGNARAFGKDMATVIESVEVFDISEMKNKIFNNIQCKFNYEGSIFKKNLNLIILSAKIKLQTGDKEKIQKEIKETIEKRISVQPQGFSSAGSFFLNPVVTDEKLRQEFEKETGAKCKDNKIPAGWLIDQVGLRGKKIGGAMISEKHANFIVNTGNATAEDVIMLASIIKQKVRTKFGVQLVEEVKFLGF
jgi:UDP-N-acetylmuramate dehydrogenase